MLAITVTLRFRITHPELFRLASDLHLAPLRSSFSDLRSYTIPRGMATCTTRPLLPRRSLRPPSGLPPPCLPAHLSSRPPLSLPRSYLLHIPRPGIH